LDVVAVFNDEDDYQKDRSNWKYLIAKLKKENIQLVSVSFQQKLIAKDSN